MIGIRVCKRIRNALMSRARFLSLTVGAADVGFVFSGSSPLTTFLDSFKCSQQLTLRLRPRCSEQLGSMSVHCDLSHKSTWCERLVTFILSGIGIGEQNIAELCKMIDGCTSLSHLNISNNSINFGCFKEFGPLLAQCTTLTHLDLGKNLMNAHGAALFCEFMEALPALQRLDLAQNALGNRGVTDLASTLPRCSSLRSLDLSCNNIQPNGAAILFSALKNCKLEQLDLSVNNIDSSCVPGLSELLNVTSSLTILNLRRTHLRAKGLESLNTTLQTCLTLQVLDLCDNHISAEGARHLSPVLGKCPNLRFLDLSENWIGVEGAEALAGVFAGCSALERLDLAHSCIETVSALAEGLSKCTRLKHLSVVGNHLEGESIGALVDSLAVCPELTSLCMNGNRVASEGAKLVGVRLPQFPKLTQLDMCDCELGASGMKNFAEGIASHNALSSLKLSDNFILDAGARWLAAKLSTCKQLSHINVSGNRIGVEGAWLLARTLGRCRALTSVHIQNNCLGDSGARAMASLLLESRSLHEVDLRRNFIGVPGRSALRSVAKRLRRPVRVNLEYNPLTTGLSERRGRSAAEHSEREDAARAAWNRGLAGDSEASAGCFRVVQHAWRWNYLRSVVIANLTAVGVWSIPNGGQLFMSAGSFPVLSLLLFSDYSAGAHSPLVVGVTGSGVTGLTADECTQSEEPAQGNDDAEPVSDSLRCEGPMQVDCGDDDGMRRAGATCIVRCWQCGVVPGHGVEIHRAALVGYILQESKRMVRGLSEGKCPGRRQKRQFNANMVVQRSNQSVRKQQRMPEACHVMVSAAHSACSVSGSAHDAMAVEWHPRRLATSDRRLFPLN